MNKAILPLPQPPACCVQAMRNWEAQHQAPSLPSAARDVGQSLLPAVARLSTLPTGSDAGPAAARSLVVRQSGRGYPMLHARGDGRSEGGSSRWGNPAIRHAQANAPLVRAGRLGDDARHSHLRFRNSLAPSRFGVAASAALRENGVRAIGARWGRFPLVPVRCRLTSHRTTGASNSQSGNGPTLFPVCSPCKRHSHV